MKFSLVHAVREPAGNTREPAPLLLLLHGVGSNEQDLMGLAPALDPRFFVVSARAPITLGHSSYGWYHVQFTPTGHIIDADEAERSLELLRTFVEELASSYNIDRQRIFLMGFSQGCIMSVASALMAPRNFAGIVGMSGRLLPGIVERAAPADELRGFPAMIVHGTQDQVLQIAFGRAIRDELQKLPVDLTYREYSIGHSVSQQSLTDIAEWLTQRLDAPDWRSKAASTGDLKTADSKK
ncbi:MAG TPA: alpha/beta fold hydrolase [Bryobacteraceae bacterium]|nr:alpha/beta fold hydrolase [Bryobacteraceae bacterium]